MAADLRGSVEPCKLFVGGLSWTTTEDSLKTYFSQYGTVTEATIMIDSVSNKPRGFGFVTFESQEDVAKALQSGTKHLLDGKQIDPKQATQKSRGLQQTASYKVFVGGIPSGTSEEELKQYFNLYSEVKSVEVKKDAATSRSRGFGFVEFDNKKACDQVCSIRFHDFKERKIEVKAAQPRGTNNQSAAQQYGRGKAECPPQVYTQYSYYQQPPQPQQQQQQYGHSQSSYNYYGYSQYDPSSYVRNTQQVAAASVPGQQMSFPPPSVAAAASYGGGGGSRAAAVGYSSNGADAYGTPYNYQDSRQQAPQATYPQYDQSATTAAVSYSHMGTQQRPTGYEYPS